MHWESLEESFRILNKKERVIGRDKSKCFHLLLLEVCFEVCVSSLVIS